MCNVPADGVGGSSVNGVWREAFNSECTSVRGVAMNIIDPKGLQEGERLAACSDLAQLHWPRLFLAANGHARLELSYIEIIRSVYRSFNKVPTEDALWSYFEEYAKNFLVILYQVDSVWWAQFVTSEKYLPRYKTARDESSPSPPLELIQRHQAGYIEWKRNKSVLNQRFQKFSEGFQKLPGISAAVVVADAVVVAKQKTTPKASPSSFAVPPWISESTWKDFEEMRKMVHAPMTDRARRGIVEDLLKLKEQGCDPEAVLLQSITRSWKGVFEIKAHGNGVQQAKPQILTRPEVNA
jgi:hypothetical protein